MRTESGPRSPWELSVFAGDAITVHPLPVSGAVSIGRAPDNDICIGHASVSRRHAILHLGPSLRLEDLGGTNATTVRANRPAAATESTENLRHISKQTVEIAPGDCITLGSTIVVIRRAQGAASAPPAGDRAAAGSKLAAGGEIVLRDKAMLALYEEAFLAARGLISVLLLGETGTGKEVLARAIHRHSDPKRARGPFLGLNCAALPESLLESELFGHEKGAFSGALQAKPGLFEAANGGTVFLDEVGELSPSAQAKLLRVLEERQVRRVSGLVARDINVRFLSATHRDLEARVASNAFREDLYFRLNGMTLTIPPLRERTADIAPLAELFTAKACSEFGRSHVPSISAEALVLLERYAFPGNIRELRNVMARAVMLCTGDTVLPSHLLSKMLTAAEPLPAPPVVHMTARAATAPAPAPAPAPASAPAPEASAPALSEVEAIDRQRIIEALDKCAGNQTYAAELLGISRRTLVSRIAKYGIPRPRRPKDK